MTGSLQIKNGKYYAVLNFKTEDGKRKQKWINTDLDVKGNKRKAEMFLQKALIKNESFSEIKTDILFCDYILKWLDSDYICVKKDGSPITPDDASYKFRLFLKKNNLSHIRLHDLRHSCASMLIAQGVDIKVIQEWLGHSSIATTGNIYGHLQFKQKIETGNMLENLLEN